MSQELPGNDFKRLQKTSQFNEDFIKGYNEDSNIGYLFEVDIHYPENLLDLQNDLPFLLARMKIKNVENKLLSSFLNIRKLLANFHNKNEHVIKRCQKV